MLPLRTRCTGTPPSPVKDGGRYHSPPRVSTLRRRPGTGHKAL
jgi:hypothetical protein